MSLYSYTSWAGDVKTIQADEVRFEPGYVVFRTRDTNYGGNYVHGRLVLAIREINCNNLRQLDEAEQATV